MASFSPLESGEHGFESPSDNSNIWHDQLQTGRTRTREIRAIARLQRALDVTGVNEIGRGLARVYARQVPDVDIRQKNLNPFEAFVFSLIEGSQPVSEVMAASGLTLFEAVTALNSLYESGLIIVEEIPLDERIAAVVDVAKPPDRGPTPVVRVALRRQQVERKVKKPWTETDPDILFSMAERAFHYGEVDRARDLVRQALVQAPNSEKALVLRERLQAPDQALERAKVLHGLGVQYYKNKNYNQAARLLRASLDEYEINPSAHHRLALALVHLAGAITTAERHLLRALELDPGNQKYQRNLERLSGRRAALRHQVKMG